MEIDINGAREHLDTFGPTRQRADYPRAGLDEPKPFFSQRLRLAVWDRTQLVQTRR